MTTKKAMLVDITMCIGCNSCQEACKTTNNLAAGEEKTLSSTTYTALNEYDGVFVRRMCQHCIDPTCASVCPVGAFTKTPEGPVLYDEQHVPAHSEMRFLPRQSHEGPSTGVR
jgi:formate dehydrogenase iron-sulfur subunit